MSRQEQGFAMEGGFVMVIYYIYSALDTKYCTWNMIFYSIPNVKDVLAAAFPFFFTSWIPFHFYILSRSLPSHENTKKWWQEYETLWTVRIHVGYLSPSTTVKMLYKLWRNGTDIHFSKQLKVSKLVPFHCYRTLSVPREALESCFNSRLVEWLTLSGHSLCHTHTCHTDDSTVQFLFIRPWGIIMGICDLLMHFKEEHCLVSLDFAGAHSFIY